MNKETKNTSKIKQQLTKKCKREMLIRKTSGRKLWFSNMIQHKS